MLASGFARYERDLASGDAACRARPQPARPRLLGAGQQGEASTLSAFQTRPEKTTQLDAGALFRTGAFSGSLSMFANRVDDLIRIESGYAKALTSMGGARGPAQGHDRAQRRRLELGRRGRAGVAMTPLVKVDASVAYVRGETTRIGCRWRSCRRSKGASGCTGPGAMVGRRPGPRRRRPGTLRAQPGEHRRPGPRPDGELRRVFRQRDCRRLARFAFVSAGVDNVLDTTYAEFVSRTSMQMGRASPRPPASS